MNEATITRRPITVYLDQNKWIDLSHAYYGIKDGEKFVETLKLIQYAVDHGIARFPISAAHIIETIEHGNIERRKRLARIMVEISQGLTIAPKEKITPFELEIALARMFNKAVISLPPEIFGLGIGFIWGISGLGLLENGLPLLMRGMDEEASAELDMRANLVKGAMDSLIYFFEQKDEVLRKEVTQRYNKDMKINAEYVDKTRKEYKNYNKEKRYLIYASGLINDPQDSLHVSLIKMGLTLDMFLSIGKDGIKAFYEAIPTLNVMIELARERDNDHNKKISENDATDISFLSVAIPYCDIIVTERFWSSLIEKKKLNTKYKTVILRDLCDLNRILYDGIFTDT
jgi:hypothetical protein